MQISLRFGKRSRNPKSTRFRNLLSNGKWKDVIRFVAPPGQPRVLDASVLWLEVVVVVVLLDDGTVELLEVPVSISESLRRFGWSTAAELYVDDICTKFESESQYTWTNRYYVKEVNSFNPLISPITSPSTERTRNFVRNGTRTKFRVLPHTHT